MGSGVGTSDADVMESVVEPEGDFACRVDAVVADAVMRVVLSGRGGLGVCRVDRRGRCVVWE